jgi:glycerol-3-phosphate acyltransferase PlsX
MGGDSGPEVIVPGAVEAARRDPDGFGVVLVGDKPKVEAVLSRLHGCPRNVEIVHASESVGMSEAPAAAVRRKKDSSIAVAIEMLKERSVDGFVSAGNTGAVVAGALVTLGRLQGVSRPAIAMFYPTVTGWVVILDIGANSSCTAKNLLQFGIMGSVFSEYHLGVPSPRVGLLNIGEERSKGTDTSREAYGLLEHSRVNFIGNVEGRDVFTGAADVVVCDGFVGNILLKFGESVVSFTTKLLREEIKKSMRATIGAALMKRAFSSFRSRLDYAEYGGAPLLGVDGVVIISHGKSTPHAIRNAVGMGRRLITFDVNKHIEERFIETADKIA